jgi:hypothetical protein
MDLLSRHIQLMCLPLNLERHDRNHLDRPR